MHWIEKHIGKKWHPVYCNCWTFVADEYLAQLGIRLDLYEKIDAENPLLVAREFIKGRNSSKWTEVEIPHELDVVLMGKGSTPSHVGLWTESDGGLIVDCSQSKGVGSMDLNRAWQMGYNLIKFYRHADNPSH